MSAEHHELAPEKRCQPEEFIGKRRHADVLLGQGNEVTEVVTALGVTAVTYDRWRQEFSGMSLVQRISALATSRLFTPERFYTR